MARARRPWSAPCSAAPIWPTPRTRAILLVTPNNPSGAEYPAEVLRGFYDLARARGLALIVDEGDAITVDVSDESFGAARSFDLAPTLRGPRARAS